MADTFNKKEREKKRDKKKQEKLLKKEARKDNAGGNWESMIMYVDANGQLTSSPPDGSEVAEISAEDIDINIPKRTDEPVDKTLTGRINYFDDKKGYGFIKTGNDESFFFHQNNVSGNPVMGKQVSFEKERGQKGWNAVRVKIL